MICSKCGKEIEDGAAFCPLCGGKQEPQSQPDVQGAAGQNVQGSVVQGQAVYRGQPVQSQPGLGQPVQSAGANQGFQGQAQQQNGQNFNNQTKAGNPIVDDAMELLKGIFSAPYKVLRGIVEKENFLLGIIFMGIQCILSGLMMMGVVKGIVRTDEWGIFYGSISYGKIFLFGLLSAIGIDAFMALFLFVFMGVVPKRKLSIKAAFSAVGLKSLANAPFLILACLGGIIAPWIGVVFAVAGMILGYIYMYAALPEEKNTGAMDLYTKYLSVLCGVLSSFLWVYIVYLIFK